ncbi:hypothetical protein E3N88_04933 [Mikania micrantha]|uniref:Uncharacterized protein n=1 Tax=Mikania micrantha TaxID=192012 RepID=A0A5N6PVV4_9ASTR|nr:hypothetical protein E3N88_04933 [Mikania micrantha]
MADGWSICPYEVAQILLVAVLWLLAHRLLQFNGSHADNAMCCLTSVGSMVMGYCIWVGFILIEVLKWMPPMNTSCHMMALLVTWLVICTTFCWMGFDKAKGLFWVGARWVAALLLEKRDRLCKFMGTLLMVLGCLVYCSDCVCICCQREDGKLLNLVRCWTGWVQGWLLTCRSQEGWEKLSPHAGPDHLGRGTPGRLMPSWGPGCFCWLRCPWLYGAQAGACHGHVALIMIEDYCGVKYNIKRKTLLCLSLATWDNRKSAQERGETARRMRENIQLLSTGASRSFIDILYG